MMVARYSTLLINDPEIRVQQRLIMTVNDGDCIQFDIEKEPECVFCKDFETLFPRVSESLKVD